MKYNSGDLQDLLNNTLDHHYYEDEDGRYEFIDQVSELENYESSRVNRTKMKQQDRLEINSKAKGRHYREPSKRNWDV